MKLRRRSFVSGGAALLASAAVGTMPAPSRAATTAVKATLPWLPLGTYSFMFVAKKLGYWEKRGLDVTVDRGFGSGKVCIPVDQGQYEFGLLDLAVMAGCVGRGLDLIAICGQWPKSPIGIFSAKEFNITKPKDLEGQTVGFDVGSGDFQLWPAFVKATGIDASKVNIVTMDGPGIMKAMADKQLHACGNFLGSIAPTLWANGTQINALFYEDYGVKGFSVAIACKKSTVEKKPELCQAFVDGAMEGLKYVYLNPDKALELHIASLQEFQGGSPATKQVLKYGQEVGTSLGVGTAFETHGLGYMDPALIEVTRQSVETYMGIKGIPPAQDLFTDRFVGSVKLTPEEWKQVAERVRRELPSMRG